MRHLGGLETYFSQQARSGDAAPVVVAARYTLELTYDRVRSAICSLIQEQPLLSAQIYSMDQLDYLKSGVVDLDNTIIFEQDQRELDVEYLNKLFATVKIKHGHDSLPLWRAFIINSQILLWVFDHSVFDGRTGTLFHREFAKRLKNPVDHLEPKTPTQLELPPPLEKLYNVNPPVWHKLGKLFEQSKGKVFAGSSRTPLGVDKTATQMFTLNNDQMLAIRQRARDLGVTVTSVLYAVLTQAIAGGEANTMLLSDDLTIKAGTSVDARRFFAKQSADKWGFYVFPFSHWLKLKPTDIRDCKDSQVLNAQWARQFNGRLVKQMNRHRTPLSWAIGGITYEGTEQLLRHVKHTKKRVSTIDMSNLGALEDEQDGIEEVWFAQGCTTLASLYTLSVLGIRDGLTNFVLSAPNSCPITDIASRFQYIIQNI